MSTDQPPPEQHNPPRRGFRERAFWKAAKGDSFDVDEILAVAISAGFRWLSILALNIITLWLSQLLFTDEPTSLVARLWGYLARLALFISFLGFLSDLGRVAIQERTLPQPPEPDAEGKLVSDARRQRSFYNRAAVGLFLVTMVVGGLTFTLASLQGDTWAASAPVLSLVTALVAFVLILSLRPQYTSPPDAKRRARRAVMDAQAQAAAEVADYNKDTAQKLHALYLDTVEKAQENIDWYTNNARLKKQRAQQLRFLSLVFIGIGGITPVMIEVFELRDRISPSIATVIIATGTGFIALDRFWGYSTAWIRFLTTELELKSMLENFTYNWERTVSMYGHHCNSDIPEVLAEPVIGKDGQVEDDRTIRGKTSYIIEMIRRCQDLRNEVNSKVRKETEMWVEEFQSNLRTFEGARNLSASSTQTPRQETGTS